MLNGYLRVGFLLLASVSVALAQQPSGLVGTWVGKVQGYEAEMKLVLNANGTADADGELGKWRVQDNRLLLTEEGETVAYNFTLQGLQLTLSGGDLMAPLILTRSGGAGRVQPAGPAGGGSQQPKAARVLEAIAGQWFYISTSSFGSSERYLNLCSDGRFSENSNIYSSGEAGTAYGEGGGGTAQWTADGDANQGTVTVTYPNGKTSQFQYQRGGGGLYVGGRKYARYGDGSCTKSSPVY